MYYIGNCNVNSNKNTSRHTLENISNKSFGLVCRLNKKNFWIWNALKACVNEIDNILEKDEKSWKCIEKDYLENFVLV